MGKLPMLLINIIVSVQFVKSFAKLCCPDMGVPLSPLQRQFERSLLFLRILHVKMQFPACSSSYDVSDALLYFDSSVAALAALQAAFIFAVCFDLPALKIDSEPPDCNATL